MWESEREKVRVFWLCLCVWSWQIVSWQIPLLRTMELTRPNIFLWNLARDKYPKAARCSGEQMSLRPGSTSTFAWVWTFDWVFVWLSVCSFYYTYHSSYLNMGLETAVAQDSGFGHLPISNNPFKYNTSCKNIGKYKLHGVVNHFSCFLHISYT